MAKSRPKKIARAKPANRPARRKAAAPLKKAGRASKPRVSSRPAKPAKRAKAAPKAAVRSKAPAKAAPKSKSTPARRAAQRTISRTGQKGHPRVAAAAAAAERSHAPVRFVTPVPTSSKPVKNRAGLKQRDLQFFRDLLLAKRRELLGDVFSMEQEALRAASGSNLSNLPIHMADMGTDNYEQEFTLGLVEKDRQLLREIDSALAKIQDGSYGICEGTGQPISRARLEAQPWARYSIEHARKMEQGLMRGVG